MSGDDEGADFQELGQRIRGCRVDDAVCRKSLGGLRLFDGGERRGAELRGLGFHRGHGVAELRELALQGADIGAGGALGEIAALQDHGATPGEMG